MRRVIDQQGQFQERFEQIKKQCQEIAKTISQGLIEGSTIRISNEIVLSIYNEIFRLAEDSAFTQASKVKKSDQIEYQLVQLFKKFLKDFIQIIQAKLDEALKDKENIQNQIIFQDSLNSLQNLS